MIGRLRERMASLPERWRPEQTGSEHAVAALRCAVLALAAGMVAWPLTVTAGVIAAAVGAISGVVCGDLLARLPLRALPVLAASALAGVLGVAFSFLPVESAVLARALGPLLAFHLGEVLLWFALAAAVLLPLRFLAQRRPLLGLLEVLAATGSIAASFAAHRQGMVNRPLAIGDWAWSRALDPAMVLLALGGAGALLLAVLMVSERQRRRLPLHLGVLLVLGALLFALVRVGGLPAPRIPDGLGKPKQERADGQERDSRDPRSRDEMPFRDDLANDGKSAPVAVAILHDDYSPPSGVYYFRQSASSQYNGERLVQGTRDDVDRDIARRFPSEPTPVAEIPARSPGRRTLRTTIGLLVDHARPFALDSPEQFAPIANPDTLRFRRVYEVVSRVPITPYEDLLDHRAGSPEWSREQWAHYTEHPADVRYEQLARQVTSSLKGAYSNDPLAKALAIKYYLDETGTYSLKNKHAGADPVGSFLFGDMTGYCIHFSHAAVFMFRALDIPARVATGYAVPESDRGAGSAIMIRGGNAHAWPEIYLEGVGWTAVDPAPHRSLEEPLPNADQTLQSMLGEMMRKQAGEPDEFLEEARLLPTLEEILRAVALALAVALLASLSVKVYRRALPAFVGSDALYRVGYRAAMDRLAEVGFRRHHGESREHFAARVRGIVPSFEAVTEQHLRWALGSRRLGQPESLRTLARELGTELGRGIPIWRRALGWLNPFSWVGVR
jgi:transglutaminase-like putative cysteine protease